MRDYRGKITCKTFCSLLVSLIYFSWRLPVLNILQGNLQWQVCPGGDCWKPRLVLTPVLGSLAGSWQATNLGFWELRELRLNWRVR